MFAPAYMDCNATSPLAEGVLDAMLPFLGTQYGNASSRHEYGRAARKAVDEARQRVAAAAGAHPTEIVFTSGGSEANNLFLRGAAGCLSPGLISVSAVEHPCVREPVRMLARSGWMLDEIAVDANGSVQPEAFEADAGSALARVAANSPWLVSVMLANNETGVVQDVPALAESAIRLSGARRGISCFHSDAVQAFGRIPLDFRALNAAGVHALSLSAHKIGGPKGVGALILDKRVELLPQIAGGGHERGLRSGTENVAGIVGFGMAAERAAAGLAARAGQLGALRHRLEEGLLRRGACIFGRGAPRLPNTCYFAFDGLDGETLVLRLDRDGYAVAAGAACSSANPEPSRVLIAMGVHPELARGAVRVSLGEGNTPDQIDDFLRVLDGTLAQLKGLRALAA